MLRPGSLWMMSGLGVEFAVKRSRVRRPVEPQMRNDSEQVVHTLVSRVSSGHPRFVGEIAGIGGICCVLSPKWGPWAEFRSGGLGANPQNLAESFLLYQWLIFVLPQRYCGIAAS